MHGMYHASMGLDTLLQDLGMSYAELADLVGVSRSSMKRWKSKPTSVPPPMQLLFNLLKEPTILNFVKTGSFTARTTVDASDGEDLLTQLTSEESKILTDRATKNLRSPFNEALFLLRSGIYNGVSRDVIPIRSINSTKGPRPTKSGYKGVYPYNGRWQARTQIAGEVIRIGVFDTPLEAAEAYDDFMVEAGLTNNLNFMDEATQSPTSFDLDPNLPAERTTEEIELSVIDVVDSTSTFNDGWED